MEEEEFKVGDKIKIVQSGCNNSNAPEYQENNYLTKSDTIYTVIRIEKEGKYLGSNNMWHTLILNTGHPVWDNHCIKVESVINNYQIY